MDKLDAVRVCTIRMGKKRGSLQEKLVEFIPNKSTVWQHIEDDMGMSKMMRNITYKFELIDTGGSSTKIISESYYEPANAVAKVINPIVIKRMFHKGQRQILSNIKQIVEQ
jgi:hypothetical protein